MVGRRKEEEVYLRADENDQEGDSVTRRTDHESNDKISDIQSAQKGSGASHGVQMKSKGKIRGPTFPVLISCHL